MRKWIIGAGVTIIALALGVGAAYGGSQLIKAYRPQIRETIQSARGNEPLPNSRIPQTGILPGARDGNGIGPLQRMLERMQQQRDDRSGVRITLDQAIQAAQTYTAGLGANLQLARVLEFQNGFYAVITEKDTGRGALELQIDPLNGRILPGMGPNRMWNLKYARLDKETARTGDNTVTLDQARLAAQTYLDTAHPGAKLNEGGIAFYGYYSFDYSVDGKTAGILSVSGTTQQVWEPAGLGAFVAEKEMTK
jgi:hypothetical protein